MHQARAALVAELQRLGLEGEVQGRPKHLYSIWKKMQGKGLSLEKVFDLRALRVIVPTVDDCYAVLARLHEIHQPVDGEFDDYIARPKPNGYQSLHTVVRAPDGQTMEVQIRTRAMHEHAEHGVAAHWAYKEAGAKRLCRHLAGQRRTHCRGAQGGVAPAAGLGARRLADQTPPASDEEARIFVFTPQAAVVELCAGATPIDFAYALHTELGHRIRGAKVDGQMVPLTTPLHSGQTVEVMGGKERGPSLDWLNAEAGYLKSPRSRAKVRAWFNALQLDRDRGARSRGGREAARPRGQDGDQTRRAGQPPRLQECRAAVRGSRQG